MLAVLSLGFMIQLNLPSQSHIIWQAENPLHRYTVVSLGIGSGIELPKLTPVNSAETIAGSTIYPGISIKETRNGDWRAFHASPRSPATVQMAPGNWHLELQSVGWCRACYGNDLS
jgi:hypothetical protein